SVAGACWQNDDSDLLVILLDQGKSKRIRLDLSYTLKSVSCHGRPKILFLICVPATCSPFTPGERLRIIYAILRELKPVCHTQIIGRLASGRLLGLRSFRRPRGPKIGWSGNSAAVAARTRWASSTAASIPRSAVRRRCPSMTTAACFFWIR